MDQTIKVGTLVESKSRGCQGIVRNIYPNLWSMRCESMELTKEWVQSTGVIISENMLAETWYDVADFGCDYPPAAFASNQSDLKVISLTQVRFSQYPASFSGKIIRVTPTAEDLVIQISTDQAYKAHQPSILVIKDATVTPYVGDSICGALDMVIISAEGLDYPYTMVGNELEQHWNLPLLAPIRGYQTDPHPTKKVFRIEVPADLDANGLESGVHFPKDLDFNEESIHNARLVIREYFQRIHGPQKAIGSYGLKHVVEQHLGYHLSNGELMVAMIGEGYSLTRNGINGYFNVSLHSVKALKKRITPKLKTAQ